MKCPDCGLHETTHDPVSQLDQCPDRDGCGYGWFDRDEEEPDVLSSSSI